ncbi:hypothetical protein IGK15_002946 [Enterococcus sp. AZ045]|uniref:hypothetical protein n=1 Tax=Enterococcus sp. AZ045 TaxID=2774807 RepID=UPI003F212DA3
MKKKCCYMVFLLVTLLGISGSSPVQVEAREDVMYVAISEEKGFPVINEPGTDDKDEIYRRYEDNSFSLMNKEFKSLNKINEFRQNLDSMIKNWIWSAASATGRFNARMVKGLFSLDLATQIKAPFQELSLDLADSLSNVATTFGIVMVALFMVIKYAMSGRMMDSVKVFLLAILTMTSFAFFSDPKGNDVFFDAVISIDHQLEKALAGVNPNFKPEGQTKFVPGQNAGESGGEDIDSLANRLAAEVFYNNVYIPYLYMQYGTANETEIREKSIEYNGKTFDRIGALLDNDSASEAQVSFVEDLTDYEVDELGNTNPIYTNANRWATLAFLYTLTNILQFVIYVSLGIVRVAFQFLLIAIPVFLPVALLFSMIVNGKDILGSYFKGLGTIMFIKGGISLLMVIFMSYVTLAYSVMNTHSNDPLDRVIVFIAWIVAPPFLFVFRRFLAVVFTPGPYASKLTRMSMALRHPIQANRQASHEKAQQRAALQNQRKAAQERYKKKQQEEEGNGSSKNDLNKVKGSNNLKNSRRNDRNQKLDGNQGDKNVKENGETKNEKEDKDLNQAKNGLTDKNSIRGTRKEKPEDHSSEDKDHSLKAGNKNTAPMSDKRTKRTIKSDPTNQSASIEPEASNQELKKPPRGQEESEKRTKRSEPSNQSVADEQDLNSKGAMVNRPSVNSVKKPLSEQRKQRQNQADSLEKNKQNGASVSVGDRQIDPSTGEILSDSTSKTQGKTGQTVQSVSSGASKKRSERGSQSGSRTAPTNGNLSSSNESGTGKATRSSEQTTQSVKQVKKTNVSKRGNSTQPKSTKKPKRQAKVTEATKENKQEVRQPRRK